MWIALDSYLTVMNLDEGQIVHFQFSFHVLISHTLFDDGGDAVLPVHWTELPTSPKIVPHDFLRVRGEISSKIGLPN